MRTELCRAEHRALLFWIQTGDGGQGVHWNLRARVFFPAKTTTGVPRRGGAPCRLTCCALPVAARACSLHEMLLNGDLRLAALAVSVASTRAWPGKKSLADPDRPLRRGRKDWYPWFDKLAAAQQRPRVLVAAKLGRRRRVCFERVPVATEDTVANARRFECLVSGRETGSGPIWPGPAWSL